MATATMPDTAPASTFHHGPGQFRSKAVDQSWFAEPIVQTEHPRYRTPEEGAALLARDGYLVIPDLFSPDEVDRLYDYAVHGGEPDAAYEFKDWCFNKVLQIDYRDDPSWLWTADMEPAIEQLDRLLGSDCKLGNSSVWITGAGRKMEYHVDLRAVHLPPDAALPEGIVMPCLAAVLIASLIDEEVAHGPTMVIPGSHLRAPGPRSAPLQPRAVPLKRGQGLLLRTDVCHGAMPNVGPQRRYHFHANWGASNHVNQDCPMRFREKWNPAVISAATPRQRRILGDRGDAEAKRAY